MNESTIKDIAYSHAAHAEDKRRYSRILIMSVFSTQVAVAAILSSLDSISKKNSSSFLTTIFYILTLLASIPQAGLSDDSGRKKHLLISSCIIFASLFLSFLFVIFNIHNSHFSAPVTTAIAALPICLMAIAGNLVPIARGCLISLKIHDFRSALGLTTVVIGLGWITENLLSFLFSQSGTLFIALILQLTVVIFIKYFYNYTDPDEKITGQGFFDIVFKSYKWFGHMLLVAGGAAAFFAYLLSETSFYQIYSLDEAAKATIGKKVIGALMGVAYFAGVITQSIVNPSDRKSIKFGVILSLFALILIFIQFFFNSDDTIILKKINGLKLNGFLQFCFSFGFGYTVPALFSLMSKRIQESHYGRLFGAVDATDTVALWLSSFLLYMQDKIKFNNQILQLITLNLFFVSLILYFYFVNNFKTYEEISGKK